MEYDRKLINYLPYVIKNTEEFEKLMSAEDNEISNLWHNIEKLKCECFVVSAENIGLNRMEKICKLSNNEFTADERRRNIIAKLMGDRPYTMSTLYKRLKILCGNGFKFIYGQNPYTLFISIDISNKKFLNEIENMLIKCTPANIGLTGGLSYSNTAKLYSSTLLHIKNNITVGHCDSVIDEVHWDNIIDKPNFFMPSIHKHNEATVLDSGFVSTEFIKKLNDLEPMTAAFIDNIFDGGVI